MSPFPSTLDYILIKCLFAHFLIYESHVDSLLPLSCPLPNSLIFACGVIQKELIEANSLPFESWTSFNPLENYQGP